MKPKALSLVAHVARTTRLIPLGVSSLAGSGIVAVPYLMGVRFELLDVTSLLHVSMAITLVGATFVLDDRGIASTRVLPISAAHVALYRIALALALITVAWLVQLTLAPQLVDSSVPYRARGLFIEPYALLAWMWTLTWWRVSRNPDGNGSTVAAPALVFAAAVLPFLPQAAALYVTPGDAGFDASRLRWYALALFGSAALCAVLKRR